MIPKTLGRNVGSFDLFDVYQIFFINLPTSEFDGLDLSDRLDEAEKRSI